jgi:5-methylcytosine-specific restriction endonuclease McrA
MVTIEISSVAHAKLLEIKEKSKHHKEIPISEMIEHAISRYYEKKLDEVDYRRYIPRAKLRLLSNQQWSCYFCRRSLTKENSTLDHLTPLARGGLSEGGNLVAVCFDCNQEKEDMTEEEYREYRIIKLSTAIH